MSPQEAKRVLSIYRPGTADAEDPEVKQALELAERDPELRRWLAAHVSLRGSMKSALGSIEPPAGLKEQILRGAKILPMPSVPVEVPTVSVGWWRGGMGRVAALAAALVIAVGLFALVRPAREGAGFDTYEARMVSMVQRQYRMDVASTDLGAVRGYMKSKGAPDSFEIPPGMREVGLAGGGFVRWRNHPVSMICFRRPDQQMMYLFVMARSAVTDPPPEKPSSGVVRGLASVRWSRGDLAYLLSGPDEPGFAERYGF